MALQVWLPLNGTLENKGLSNVTVTGQGTVAYDNNGKIGKCFISGGTSLNTNGISLNSNFLSMFNTTKGCSVAAWIKPVGTHVHYNGTIISSGNWNGSCWAFGVSLDNTRVDVFSSGYNRWIDCNIPVNQWTHLACTFLNGTSKVYKNGKYVGELGGFGNFTSDASNTCIGRETYASGYFGFNGRINDVRIYDHALSAKEVKEISKGLILHYKLDGNDIGITIPRNGGLIPDGVELYDYILSSGTLWIDTGYVLKNTDVVDVTYDRMAVGWVFGSRASSGSLYSAITNEDNGSSTYNIRYGNTILYTTSPQPSGTVTVHIESGNTKINGSTVSTTAYGSSFYSGNCYLFTINNNGTAYSGTYGTNKIRRFSIKGVCNMLPCTYLGEPGMWDTVENKFYRNQGTGQFTLGNKITLKEYEYLLSSGTQYIDTGISTKSDILVTHECQLKLGANQSGTQYTGAQNGNYWGVGSDGYWCAGGISCGAIADTNIHIVKVDILTTTASSQQIPVQIDGNKYFSTRSNSVTAGIPIGIFAIPDNISSWHLSNGSRIYWYKLYEDNQLVRDFIPVSYNGTPGLWDKVEWKFYANAGSGSFTLGPEKTVQQDAPIFYDSSGYCNHGSITGTLTTSNDSLRYTKSTVFNGSSRITSNNINLPGTSLFTISCWVYRTGSQNYWPTFWLGNGTTSLGIAMHGPAIDRIQGGNGTNSFNNTGSTGISVNTWAHLVLVYNGSNVIEYLNGSQVNSIAYSYGFGSTLVRMYVGYFWGSDWGTSFTGRLSDVRLYATALSEDDVKELYNTSAFVTNNGVFAEYELYEDNLSDVKKRGLLETANFYENGAESGYALDTDKTRVASNYIISEDFIEI